MLIRLICTIAIIVLALQGCSNTTAQPTDPTLGPDPAAASLAEAASSVSKSLISLDQMQQATTPLPDNLQVADPASYGMADLVTIDWNGPIEPLLIQIANATGYQLNKIGKAPAIPIIVTIVAKNKPIGEVLRNAGYQCQSKADIVIFPKTKVIELRYADKDE